MSQPDLDLLRTITDVSNAAAGLPESVLSGAERVALSGHCFAAGPELVRLVSRVLRPDPAGADPSAGPFSDIEVDPAALLGSLRRSEEALRLAELLQALARRALDLHLGERAAAVSGAMAVVEQVRRTAALPFAGPALRRQQRGDAMLRVEALLRKRTKSKRRAELRNARRAADAPAPKPRGKAR